MKKLLFVDSNIYLDFYRVRTEAGLSLLDHLDAIPEKLIVTSQIEMEFKKHRQGAILETITSLKPMPQMPRPGLLSKDKSMQGLQTDLKNTQKRIKTVKARLRRVLKDPIKHDPVYKVAQRIFTKDDDLNLTRAKADRRIIRRRALRRFLSGYPPRKKNDTSIGDAFNWEWIVEVCKRQKANVHIVSRDSDYGCQMADEAFINDWLLQEFRDRTSKQRKVVLHTRLSEALKEFQVPVTKQEVEEEDDILSWLVDVPRDLHPLTPEEIARLLDTYAPDQLTTEIATTTQ